MRSLSLESTVLLFLLKWNFLDHINDIKECGHIGGGRSLKHSAFM